MIPRKSLFILLFLLATAILHSQSIFIYDQQTGEPISNVFIFNDDNTATSLSNEKGYARIEGFSVSDNIQFQHPSYNNLILDLLLVENMRFKVPLNQKLINLEEVVVSANRWEMKTYEVPNSIDLIKSKNIIFENPATSADMLTSASGVYIQKSQLGGGSPMIRGFSANKILFAVDGIRMNNAIYRGGNLQNVLQADVNSIESAEVIYGPGTNVYGSDALGGVIDIHILNPILMDSNNWKASGHAFARFASADVERTLHADVNVSNDKWGILTMFSYSAFDDLVMGTMNNDYNLRKEYVKTSDGYDTIVQNSNPRTQRYSGYNQVNFTTKITNKINDKIKWSYGFYLSRTSAVPRYDRLLEHSDDQLKYAVWEYDPQQWMMHRLSFDFDGKTDMYDHMNIRLAYQDVKEGRNDRKYKNEWLRKRLEHVQIVSLNNDYDKSLRNQQFLYYGLEMNFNNVISTGEEINIFTGETNKVSTRYPDGSNIYLSGGAYFTYKKNFISSPLTFIGGARLSHTSLNSQIDDTTFYNLPYNEIKFNHRAVTGSLGLVYHPSTWQLHLNMSSGFRSPNLDDAAKIFDSEPGNVVVPNQNLNPEYIYSIDAGVIKKFNGKARIELTGFYSFLDQAIVRRDFQLNGQDSIIYDGELSRVQAMVNAGYANVYGASMTLNVKIIRNFVLISSLTYIKGEDDEGYALRHAPPLFGKTTLSFERSKLKLQLSSTYNATVSYENLAPSERNEPFLYATDADGNPYSPKWWTLDFKGSYAFNEKLLLTFGVENILNYRYRPYSSGITAPGRNFIIAFRYNF